MNTGVPAFAKSRNVSDNTRNDHSKTYLLAQQVHKQISVVGNAVDQQLGERLICTNDEEDDLPVSAPARKQLQSILAYFLSAYLSLSADPLSAGWYLTPENPVAAFNHAQLCVFRI
ncbi:hypothetical protein LWM68_41390 [Niabella sp. W65]|nr:hypothetical protein [Niabella sp. W65]MCH7368625.1 hypothetical protein [Niabella sp. W65]ULT44211.1 hypothetical protein KRR40_13115 [Niabella sp. I65]